MAPKRAASPGSGADAPKCAGKLVVGCAANVGKCKSRPDPAKSDGFLNHALKSFRLAMEPSWGVKKRPGEFPWMGPYVHFVRGGRALP